MSKKISKGECEKFRINSAINPKTGKGMYRKTFNSYVEGCEFQNLGLKYSAPNKIHSNGKNADLESKTVKELKEILSNLYLKKTGLKKDLILRIVEHSSTPVEKITKSTHVEEPKKIKITKSKHVEKVLSKKKLKSIKSTPKKITKSKPVNKNKEDSIFFYEKGKPYYEFSNYYEFPKKKTVVIDGKTYRSTEHYFQSMKFLGKTKNKYNLEYAELIRNAKTANIARELASQKIKGGWKWRVDLNTTIKEFIDKGVKIRPDWEDVKDEIMEKALRAKFSQFEDLKRLLQSTGDKYIAEHTTRDKYWGDNGDGAGKNMLGNLLMKIRDE